MMWNTQLRVMQITIKWIRIQKILYSYTLKAVPKSLLRICSRSQRQETQGLFIRRETIQYHFYSNIPWQPGLTQRSSVHINTTYILTIKTDLMSAHCTDRPH